MRSDRKYYQDLHFPLLLHSYWRQNISSLTSPLNLPTHANPFRNIQQQYYQVLLTFKKSMKSAHQNTQVQNYSSPCQSCICSELSPSRKRSIIIIVYLVLVILLTIAVYAATTITLHKAEIAPQNPSDLACLQICPMEYGRQVDGEHCCTEDSLSCKTKPDCKSWILEHDRNYAMVAYAYIALFSCIVLVHIFICIRRKCEKQTDSTRDPRTEKRQIRRWVNKNCMDSHLSDTLFQNETKCEVCLKEITPKKALTLPCCGSLVHPKCMKGWLQQLDNCPGCGKLLQSLPNK